MNSDNFYAELPTLKCFVDITYEENFQNLPEDWYVVVTDVVESTKAIASGKYKQVNLLGSCSIVAILNVAQDLEIPFVFGGDGASLLIPPSLLRQAEQALLGVRDLALNEFNLDLRVGIVPFADIKEHSEIKIAKLRISENYSQAILRGGGVNYATNLVKDNNTTHLYFPKAAYASVDFSGLECRWQDIPTRHEEILSLIVYATTPKLSQADQIYREAITAIDRIYGNELDFQPVVSGNLQLSFRKKNLMSEVRVFVSSKNWFKQFLRLWKLRLLNLSSLVLVCLGAKINGWAWQEFKQIIAGATDFRKFDDTLRMVISGTSYQRQQLISYLETKFQEGQLVYGEHVSNRALMTCLVFEQGKHQVHFVDGADGGYALAALKMKQRLQK